MNNRQASSPSGLLNRHIWMTALWAVSALSCSLWLVDRVWNGSADFAHHYALVRYLADNLILATAANHSLLAMGMYPPATHVIAAMVGHLVGSSLLGMQLTSLLSLALLWGSFAWWLAQLPMRAFGPSALVFVALIAVAATIKLELHGDELVSNYFYSQLVAQAVAVWLIAVVVRLWKSDRYPIPARVAWLLPLSAPLVSSLHLLAGLLLLATFCMTVVLDALVRPREALTCCLRGLTWALAGLVAIVLTPAFKAFLVLAENDGSIDLKFIHSIKDLVVLASVVLVLAAILGAWWLSKARRGPVAEWAAVKMFAAYGAGLALLCFVQIVALAFGYGSAYACRKYTLALDVILCLQLSAITGLAMSRELPPLVMRFLRWVKVTFPATCCVFVFAITLSDRVTVVSLHTLMQVDAFASDYQRLDLDISEGRYAYAIDVRGLTPVMNYLISIATLHSPAQPNGFDVLNASLPSDRKSIAYILTSVASQWDAVQCRKHKATNGLLVMDAPCVFQEKAVCKPNLDFTENSRIAVNAITGFSPPWAGGRWSVSANARFRCTVEGVPPRFARLQAYGYFQQGHNQRMSISVNGASPVNALLTSSDELKSIDIPLPPASDGEYAFDFAFPDAKTPYELGISGDRRLLAVGIRSLQFD